MIWGKTTPVKFNSTWKLPLHSSPSDHDNEESTVENQSLTASTDIKDKEIWSEWMMISFEGLTGGKKICAVWKRRFSVFFLGISLPFFPLFWFHFSLFLALSVSLLFLFWTQEEREREKKRFFLFLFPVFFIHPFFPHMFSLLHRVIDFHFSIVGFFYYYFDWRVHFLSGILIWIIVCLVKPITRWIWCGGWRALLLAAPPFQIL